MTLQEALKVNGRAVRRGEYDGVFALSCGKLYIEFRDGKGCHAAMSFEDSLKDEFLPFKEPCKHEPNYPLIQEYQTDSKGYFHPADVKRMIDVYRYPKCKCGAYIKQEGKWVEV